MGIHRKLEERGFSLGNQLCKDLWVLGSCTRRGQHRQEASRKMEGSPGNSLECRVSTLKSFPLSAHSGEPLTASSAFKVGFLLFTLPES